MIGIQISIIRQIKDRCAALLIDQNGELTAERYVLSVSLDLRR